MNNNPDYEAPKWIGHSNGNTFPLYAVKLAKNEGLCDVEGWSFPQWCNFEKIESIDQMPGTILEKIKTHPKYNTLGFVTKNRLCCTAYISWVNDFIPLIAIDREEARSVLQNHSSFSAEMKEIYFDVLEGYFTQ